jgi:hypothetical protein
MRIGYARVSTREQNSGSQRQLLVEAGCEEIFLDAGVSGRTASRPQLDRALARLRRGDTQMLDQRTAENRPVWNITALARHFKVSRPTVYKLIDDRADLAARIAGQ